MARLGIIVPFRNREEHLAKFVPHIISYFHRDKADKAIEPLIIIAEQNDQLPFNRGGLLNAGFLSIEDKVDYLCFHDVDYLPMWADYSMPANPTRIIWWGMHIRPLRVNDSSRWVTAAAKGLGAVALFRKEHFRRINGFSNQYFGWGFEDADLEARCEFSSLEFQQRNGTFIPLNHDNLGFEDDGRKSAAWIENEQRFMDLRQTYALGTIEEGLTTFPAAIVGSEW